jgi:hypothetical protein
MENADIERSIKVAMAHFCDKSTSVFGPTGPGFRRWLSVYWGIEADKEKSNGAGIWTWKVTNIRDPEKAIMFKLRF